MSALHCPLTALPVTDNREFVYELDGDDRIVAVNDAFHEFAEENGSPGLGDRVVGHPVWQFVADDRTRNLYKRLLARARATGNAYSVPFRCDAPTVIRHMQIVVEPLQDGGLLFRTSMLEERERPRIALLDATGPRSAGTIQMCSWCKAIQMDDDWVDLEVAVARHESLARPPLPSIAQGVCGSCQRELDSRILGGATDPLVDACPGQDSNLHGVAANGS